MAGTTWSAEIEHELSLARDARRRGNEGRARVCARRAAGFAARIYLQRCAVAVRGSSVLDLLDRLATAPGIDDEIRRRTLLFAVRVDTDFKLPEGVDLIHEAELLCTQLLR